MSVREDGCFPDDSIWLASDDAKVVIVFVVNIVILFFWFVFLYDQTSTTAYVCAKTSELSGD